jgi:indole-3-glycerol phosphate synthase
MDFLSDILERKRVRLAEARRTCPLNQIKALAAGARNDAPAHALRRALEAPSTNVIAEIKRASPSRGPIRPDANAGELARAYFSGGAAAISVLTEEDLFRGSLSDLREVRAAVSIPILRKDFIFDDYQVYESAAAKADALLLIVAALDDEALARLIELTETELGMDALVEVHAADEVERAVTAGARLIGVNNRNLRTFEVTLDVSKQLASIIPREMVAISESGLRTREDLDMLRTLGYRGFLIGESLMLDDDPEQALRNLVGDATG